MKIKSYLIFRKSISGCVSWLPRSFNKCQNLLSLLSFTPSLFPSLLQEFEHEQREFKFFPLSTKTNISYSPLLFHCMKNKLLSWLKFSKNPRNLNNIKKKFINSPTLLKRENNNLKGWGRGEMKNSWVISLPGGSEKRPEMPFTK